MSTNSIMHRFSTHLKWAMLAIVAILLLPPAISFFTSLQSEADRLKVELRRLERYHRAVAYAVQTNSAGTSLSFPDCIKQTELSPRDFALVEFSSVTNLSTATPTTIICRVKDRFSQPSQRF